MSNRMFIRTLERQELPVITGTEFDNRQEMPDEAEGQELPTGRICRLIAAKEIARRIQRALPVVVGRWVMGDRGKRAECQL